jgi:hypothetical protein
MKNNIYLLFLSLSLWSCNDPKDVKPILDNTPVTNLTNTSFWVLNEGLFGSGIATVTKVEVMNDNLLATEQNAYFNKNKQYLGNVLQSGLKVGQEYWLVVNNSQKIVRCNADLAFIGELTGFNSPRYLTQDDRFVYVSDLYQKAFYRVNKVSLTIDQFETGSWNEQLECIGNQLWLPQTNANQVLIWDTKHEKYLDTITVSQEPNVVVKLDELTNLVLCNGGIVEQKTAPYLYWIDAKSYEKIDSLDLDALAGVPTHLQVLDNQIFILANNLYQIENKRATIRVEAKGRNFYNFYADKNAFWLTNALDYVRNGFLHRYTRASGAASDSVQVGQIPGFILPL